MLLVSIKVMGFIFLPKPSQCITSNYLPQGDSDPTSDLGTGFSGLDAMGKRDATEKDKGLDRPELTKYMQDRFLKLYICCLSIPFTQIKNFLLCPCARPKKACGNFCNRWWAKLANFDNWPGTWESHTRTPLLQCTLTFKLVEIDWHTNHTSPFQSQFWPRVPKLHSAQVLEDLGWSHCICGQALRHVQRSVGQGGGGWLLHRSVPEMIRILLYSIWLVSGFTLNSPVVHLYIYIYIHTHPRWYALAEKNMKASTFAPIT